MRNEGPDVVSKRLCRHFPFLPEIKVFWYN
jgi:hypothetical protein